MPIRRAAAFWRKLSDERGMALPYALGVTVVLSALSVAIFSYTTTNQGAAHRAHADEKAYALADAGLSYAFATLMNAAPPYTSVAPLTANGGDGTTVTLPGGTTRYWATLSGSTWTLYGRGTVLNPTGPGSAAIVRTVSAQAQITTTTVADMAPWDYLFVDQPSGCLTLDNSVSMDLSLYVRGDLCLNNTANVHGPKVDILGRLYVNHPQAGVGTLTNPIPSFNASGNCYYSAIQLPCGPASHVYASSIGSNPPVLTKPAIDLAGWYSNNSNEVGYLGPARNCNVGSFPGGFDSNSTLDVSRGDVDLTPSSAYNCEYRVNGQTMAQIKWEPGSPGTLTIKGVIYFDGNLTWSNLNLIQYDGKGVIYASGQIVIRNRADMCGVPDCDSTWNPQTDLLVLIAGSLISQTTTDPLSGEIGNNVNFQGAIYTVTDFSMDQYTTVWGPVITRSASIGNSATLHAPPQPILWMTGMPAATTTQASVNRVQGSYSG